MKRIFTFLVLICAAAMSLNAQSFEIYDHDNNLINDETIVIATETGSPEDVFELTVKNVSGSQITARITYTLLTTQIDGTVQSMCNPTTENTTSGLCGAPWMSNSPQFILNAGETSGYGSLHFMQGSNGGVTTIEYKVYDVNNESDYNTFTITYSTLTSVMFASENEFTVFPNPAVNSFVISNDYGQGSYVEVYNVLGMQVARVEFSNVAEAEIDCSVWEKGYYFCRLYNNGQVEKTIKLTVTH